MRKILILTLLVCVSSCYALQRECIGDKGWGSCEFYRWSVPHGWLVTTGLSSQAGITFVPDENHEWKL